jgi:hypothetical protein
VDKKQLSERDIRTKFITPALRQAGWDELTQLREEVSFTKGRITPFDTMGTPLQLIRQFGNLRDFERGVNELQASLFQEIA